MPSQKTNVISEIIEGTLFNQVYNSLMFNPKIMKKNIIFLLIAFIVGSFFVFLFMYLTAKGYNVYFLKYLALASVVAMIIMLTTILLQFFFGRSKKE